MGGDNREKPGNEVAHVNEEFAEGHPPAPAEWLLGIIGGVCLLRSNFPDVRARIIGCRA